MESVYPSRMPEPTEKMTLVSPDDLTSALAFALRFQGRKRVHNADEIMAEIVAKRLVEHLERAGFVVMSRGQSQTSFLLVIIGGLSWEAIGRFWDPQPVAGTTVMIVAGVGILINGVRNVFVQV